MTAQPDLFFTAQTTGTMTFRPQPVKITALGEQKRDAGLSSAASHWCSSSVRRELGYLIESGTAFTSDMLWDAFSPTLRDAVAVSPCVVPAMITEAAKANLIEQTGQFVKTRRVDGNGKQPGRGRRIAVWQRRAP